MMFLRRIGIRASSTVSISFALVSKSEILIGQKIQHIWHIICPGIKSEILIGCYMWAKIKRIQHIIRPGIKIRNSHWLNELSEEIPLVDYFLKAIPGEKKE
jgi:hypothetical protein